MLRVIFVFWLFVATMVLAVPGAVLLFSAFFFDRIQDWPSNLARFAGGAAFLTAAGAAGFLAFRVTLRDENL